MVRCMSATHVGHQQYLLKGDLVVASANSFTFGIGEILQHFMLEDGSVLSLINFLSSRVASDYLPYGVMVFHVDKHPQLIWASWIKAAVCYTLTAEGTQVRIILPWHLRGLRFDKGFAAHCASSSSST